MAHDCGRIVKGAGETGTIPAHPAIAAAIEDALAALGVRIRELPLTPERIRRLVAEAREPLRSSSTHSTIPAPQSLPGGAV